MIQLYESEMRNAAIEVEIREEVAKEMQQQLQKMQVDFAKRFQDQVRPGIPHQMPLLISRWPPAS